MELLKLFNTILFLMFHNSNANVFQMEEPGEYPDVCTYLLQSFANASAGFMFCSISNARPIRMCTSCINFYIDVVEEHSNIFKIGESENKTCRDELLNLDRLAIIEAGYVYIRDLWSKGNCKSKWNPSFIMHSLIETAKEKKIFFLTKIGNNFLILDCFLHNQNSSISSQLSNETKEFQSLHSELNVCLINNFNESSQEYNKEVCQTCSEKYNEMNKFYAKLKKEQKDLLCMDIVDSMNITQNLWNNFLHCGETVMKIEWPFIACTSIVLIIPVIFYNLAWKFTKTKPSVVSQQKRLSQRIKEKWRSRTESVASQIRIHS